MNDDREDRIKQRAYELWQREGSPDGRTLGHWLQAEREVQQSDSVMEEDSPNAAALRDVEREHPGVVITNPEKVPLDQKPQ